MFDVEGNREVWIRAAMDINRLNKKNNNTNLYVHNKCNTSEPKEQIVEQFSYLCNRMINVLSDTCVHCDSKTWAERDNTDRVSKKKHLYHRVAYIVSPKKSRRKFLISPLSSEKIINLL